MLQHFFCYLLYKLHCPKCVQFSACEDCLHEVEGTCEVHLHEVAEICKPRAIESCLKHVVLGDLSVTCDDSFQNGQF